MLNLKGDDNFSIPSKASTLKLSELPDNLNVNCVVFAGVIIGYLCAVSLAAIT